MKVHFRKLQVSACRELSDMVGNPPFLRLHHLALANAGPHGHAEFPRGELARKLSTAGKRYRNVEAAIANAVAYGLLDPSSQPRCLVLPTGLVESHDVALAGMPCATHGGTPSPLRMANDCHPARAHYADGLCKSCYESRRRVTVERATCHPARVHHGGGLCKACSDQTTPIGA